MPGKAFEEINPPKGVRITGGLPEGWSDNTGWKSNVVAEYGLVTEDGRRILRVQQTSADGLQFTHRLPGMEKENGYYRLTFTARSLTGVNLGVRDVGAPYSTLSSFTPATDGQWREGQVAISGCRIAAVPRSPSEDFGAAVDDPGLGQQSWQACHRLLRPLS